MIQNPKPFFLQRLLLVMKPLRLVQIVYGDGAGKTTMALGKAVRAHGSGLKVAVVQFMKSGTAWLVDGNPMISEIVSLKALGIDVYSYGREEFVNKPTPLDLELASKAFEKAVELESLVDVLVLDELLNAISFGLIPVGHVIEFIEKRGDTEFVITGRLLPDEIREKADQVTKVVSEVHPLEKGIKARKGFEF